MILFLPEWSHAEQTLKASHLVNVSIGSSSDSQQDLKILLRVPGGDVKSSPVLQIHSDVCDINIPPQACHMHSISLTHTETHIHTPTHTHTHNLTHTSTSTKLIKLIKSQKWAAEKRTLVLSDCCRSTLCLSLSHTRTHSRTPSCFCFSASCQSSLLVCVPPSLHLTHLPLKLFFFLRSFV